MADKPNRNVKSAAREQAAIFRDQRQEAHVLNSAKLRKQAITFKRRPISEPEQDGPCVSRVFSREEISNLLRESEKCLSTSLALSSADESLVELRKALSRQDDAVIEIAVELGIVELLTKFLGNSSCPANQVEAVWCITNIATGSSEQTDTVLCTAPVLVQLLAIENALLQEQCVWALGNMAGDNMDFRDRIRANGAVVPIVRLIQSSTVSLARTSCWALSNLARGLEPRLH
jgi:importin subunit alpha-6/7